MEPIEVLQRELNKYESALRHADASYNNKLITHMELFKYRERLIPKIEKFKTAIDILTKFIKKDGTF